MKLWVTIVYLFAVTALLRGSTHQGYAVDFARVIAPTRLTRGIAVVDGNDLQFRHLRAPGLSQTRVAQVVQDDKGFMWFGTQDGLNRYDGYKLKVFRHDSHREDSLSGVYIYSLLEDRSNDLWVGSDEFLDKFNPVSETFARFVVSADAGNAETSNFACITQDKSGLIWLCTRNGLYSLDPITHQTKLFRHDPNDPSTVASNAIQVAGEDRQGQFWVGSSAGLDLFDRKSQKVIHHLPLSGSQRGMCFHEDRFGIFWIIYGTEGRLAVFDRKANKLWNWLPAAKDSQATGPILFSTMLEDRDGTMWFGTHNNGILKFDRGQQRFIRYMARPSDPDGLSDRRVNMLYQDREGLIWAGLHQAEPNYFLPRSPAFQSFRFAGQPSAMVSTILQDHSGNLWLGLDLGMKRLDRKSGLYKDIPQLNGTETTSMVESSPGVFWIGTAGQGLRRYDERSGRLTSYHHNPSQQTSLPSDFVEKVAQDSFGYVWVVTWRGLARWNSTTNDFTTYMPKDSPNELTLHTVSFARDGLIWIGTNLGLYRFDPSPNRFVVFRHDQDNTNSLSNDRVNTIHQTGDGSLWIGTQNGLDHFDSKGTFLSHFTERDGVAGNTISCILEDREHRLWISSNHGISSLDTTTGHFETYGTDDGLPGLDMTGWGGCSQAKSGEMFFGGFSGGTAFFPRGVEDPAYVPPVVLTDFRLIDSGFKTEGKTQSVKPVSYTSQLSLLPSQNSFSIAFSALSFLNPETNRFRYRMQGLQDEWTEVRSDQRTATYMALPAGSYVFQVQGATSHGPWNPSGAALIIQLPPPWWESVPFRICEILIVCFALALAHRLRVRQLADTYNLRLEERTAERTRIARELHDTLLQSFQGLMFRLQAVRDLLPTQPERALPVLDTALEKGEDAIDQARSAVNDLRSQKKIEQDLDRGLAAIASEIFNTRRDGSAPSCEVVTVGHPKEIHHIVLRELYQVAQEALRNAFVHSHAGKIKVEVRYGNNALQIRFEDDGIGMDVSLLESGRRRGHWGLLGMKERVEKLGGKLSLRSQPPHGTEVVVSVPPSVAYATHSFAGKLGKFLALHANLRNDSRE